MRQVLPDPDVLQTHLQSGEKGPSQSTIDKYIQW
jgi:hypothetical protein